MRKRTLAVASGAAALILALGTGLVSAWACTPQPRSFSIAPAAASAGSVATVVGQGVPAGSPVDVRWDGLKGEIIGSAMADERGQFQAAVTIPVARPGVHAVIFSAGDANQPSVTGIGRLPFKLSPIDGQPAARPTLDHWAQSDAPVSAHGAGGRDLATGLGIFGLGVTTLAGGTAVAVMGRRRVRVGAPS